VPCEVRKDGERTVIICTRYRAKPPSRCRYCGRPCTKLCDFPVERNGKVTTCDAKMCGWCATHVGHEKDLCRAHATAEHWDYEKSVPRVGPGVPRS